MAVPSTLRRLWAFLLAYSGVAHAATNPPKPYGATPTAQQLAWHRMEYFSFVHYGPNTYTGEEWGHSQATPDVFNPSNLDTDQWAKAFADAGMTGMILTAKHHDGMCLWNTNTTTYKVANSAWAKKRVAAGLDADVVRMAAQSCKKYGIKFGVYLSPWDIHRDPNMAKSKLAGTIYDEPQIFGDQTKGDYNDFWIRQLTELLTMKLADNTVVDVFELWLDGANGSKSKQTYNFTMWRDVARKLQPNMIIHGDQGFDVRWVGNEDGHSIATNWHTLDHQQDETFKYPGQQLTPGVRDGKYWIPAETNSCLRTGWFWHSNEKPKSTQQSMDSFWQSIAWSTTALLDVPPNTDGLVANDDIAALMAYRSAREAILNKTIVASTNIATASSVRGNDTVSFGPAKAIDGDFNTYWTMDDGEKTGWLEVDLGGTYSVIAFIVQEHIALGQRIGGYAVETFTNGRYTLGVNGTSMGYKRIDRLKSAVEATKVRLRITQANAVPLIQSFQVLGTKRD